MERKEKMFKIKEDFLEEHYSLFKSDLLLGLKKEEELNKPNKSFNSFKLTLQRDTYELKEEDYDFLESNFKFVYY